MSRCPLLDRGVAVAIVAVGVLAIHVGCSQPAECVTRCDGNTKVTCGGGNLAPAMREDCGSRTCTEDQRSYGTYVACAIAGRDRRCNPETDTYVCDGDLFVACSGAYAEVITDCAAGGRHCIVGAGGLADCTDQPH